jgi:hypothetical protein
MYYGVKRFLNQSLAQSKNIYKVQAVKWVSMKRRVCQVGVTYSDCHDLAVISICVKKVQAVKWVSMKRRVCQVGVTYSDCHDLAVISICVK